MSDDTQNKDKLNEEDLAPVPESSVDPLAALEKQCQEYKQGWQRALSDYQNLQKEVARQRAEWVAMSESHVLEEFLPIYSNFKKAFAGSTIHDTWNTIQAGWVKGIEYIMKQFGDALKSHGIEEIKTVGELFDASKHETVGEEESEEPEHTVVKEVEVGYMMKNTVIKVAKVIVAKHDT